MNTDVKPIDIMINYLHRRKGIECELHMNEYDIDADGTDWTDPGDDPMVFRKDYDLDLAKLLDGYEDGDDLTQKEGFLDLFVKARLPKDPENGFARYDALFRDTHLHYSIFPESEWKNWGKFRLAVCHLTEDTTTMKVLKAVYVKEDPVNGPNLSLKVRGSAWAPIDTNEVKE